MKKSLVSFLIAGVLFFSSVGTTTFAVDNSLNKVNSQLDSENSKEGASAEKSKSTQESNDEEEISYYKISDFTALPENISNQKVRIGAGIDAIEFPDTLEVKVVPDLYREDRIMRKLAQERERMRREREQEEADAAASASSDKAASEGSSFDEDEEGIIFFGDDEITDEAGELSGEEENEFEEYENYEEPAPEETSSQGNTISPVEPEEPDESEDEVIVIDDPIDSGSEESIGDDSDYIAPDDGEGAEEDSSAAGFIGSILNAFRGVVAYAADSDGDASDLEESKELEESENSEESIERISGIEWILEPEYNDGVDFFSPDYEGQIYLFTPVLILPDNYYIEDELPIITVTVTDEFFPFDEKVEVDGVTIRVRADKGVFPEGATVSARTLEAEDQEKVQEAFDEQVEVDAESIVKQYTFDITILDRDGNEIEPDTEKGRVFVSFETDEVLDSSLSAEVYHILDSSEVEEEEETAEEEQDTEDAIVFFEDGIIESELYAEAEPELEEEITDAMVLGAERNSDFSEESVLVVEKLESSIVNVDESKAVEAETFSFSTYKVVFVESKDYPVTDEKVIKVDEILKKVLASDTYADIGSIAVVNAENTEDEYFFKAFRLGSTVADENGLYGTANTGEWYLVIKRPFDKPKRIKVSYVSKTLSTPQDIFITITNDDEVQGADMFNDDYPNAIEFGDDDSTFKLKIHTDLADDSLVLFQWQRKEDNKDWEDIDCANTSIYGGKASKEKYWYRCCVDGNYSQPVQIITKKTDTRSWVSNYKPNHCYVSNGKIAYTRIDNNKIDIVGEFVSGSTKYMLQTTSDGKGWTLYNDANTSATTYNTEVFSGTNPSLKNMFIAFDGDDLNLLHVVAELGTSNKNFALAARAKIGDNSKNTAIATLDGTSLEDLAIIGANKEETVQIAINNGTGDSIPSLLIIPETTSGLKYYMGESTTEKPYASSSIECIENTKPQISMSWESVTDESVVFDFRFAGAESNSILDKYEKKATYTYSGSSTKVKNAKPVGDELTSYAQSLGTPTEDVLVNLTLKASTSGSSAISSRVSSYNTTSSNSNSSSNGSTNVSNASSKYTADYLDATVKQTIGTKTESVDDLTKIIKLELAYDFSEINDIKVLREHKGAVAELSESSSGADGTYQKDKDAGKLYIYTDKFSTFAVAYKKDVYYSVTFNDGTNTNVVKVKAGDKVAKPDDPVKEGYVFKGWFLNGNTTSAYDFDTAVNSNITLKAGWVTAKEAEGANPDEKGDSRAPGTNDSLPIVWLWVLVLLGGVSSFGYSFYERFKASGGNGGKPMNKLQKTFLLIGIVVSTVVKFVVKKIKQHKYECMLAASAGLIIISAVTLISTFIEYRKAEEIYIDVNDEYVDEIAEETSEMAKTSGVRTDAEQEADWWQDVSVDVARLSEEYPDVVGWIYFENEDISYPIMYSGDNSKYLSTAYTGESARAGAIFIDGESTPDFSDPHSLIYGHNMRDLSMFGRLRYYKNDSTYYDEHQYFQVFTKEGVYRYHIFAYEEVPDNHDVFWVYGENPQGMDEMLKEIEKASYRKTDVEPTEADHVITLATCTSNEDKRLIISAVREDEHLIASR